MGIAHAAGVQSGKQRAEVGPDARLSAAGPAAVGLGESVRLEKFTPRVLKASIFTII